MPNTTLTIPEGTLKRESATRHACALYLYGGVETDFKPCRSLSRLSKISGVHVTTLTRVSKEDCWDGAGLSIVENHQLASLPLLPSFGDKLTRIQKQLDLLIDAWEECEVGSDEAGRMLSQIEKCAKLLGLDRRISTAARIEEIQLKKQLIDGEDDTPVAGKILDVG